MKVCKGNCKNDYSRKSLSFFWTLAGTLLTIIATEGSAMQRSFTAADQNCMTILENNKSDVVPEKFFSAIDTTSRPDDRKGAAKDLLEIRNCVKQLQTAPLRQGSAKRLEFYEAALKGLESFGINWQEIETIANPIPISQQPAVQWDNAKMEFLNGVNSSDVEAKYKKASAARGTISREDRQRAASDLLKIKTYVSELLPLSRAGSGSRKRLEALSGALTNLDNLGVRWDLLEQTAGTSAVPTGPAGPIQTPVKIASAQQFASGSQSDRKSIFDVNQQCATQGYQVAGAPLVDLPQMTKITQNQSKEVVAQPSIPFGKPYKTQIRIMNKDSLNHGIDLIQRGEAKKPLIMDMAHASLPCGLANTGEGNAQEEQICYRSNLFTPLNGFKQNALASGKGRNDYFIPDLGGILVPQVAVFRNDDYSFIPSPIMLDIFATAAYRHKSRKALGKIIEEDLFPALKDESTYWNNTKQKIRAMFQAGIKNGNDALVLSAFGTGAFKNPVDKIIGLFTEVCQEYDGAFKYVDFVIMDPGGRTISQFQRAFS